jgi:hypothetical protein
MDMEIRFWTVSLRRSEDRILDIEGLILVNQLKQKYICAYRHTRAGLRCFEQMVFTVAKVFSLWIKNETGAQNR